MPITSCTICHVDLEEGLAQGGHGPAGVQCDSCHGPSQGHVTDEHNNVKPDRLFTRETAPAFCGTCHPSELTGCVTLLKTSDCIECHGAHEIVTGRDLSLVDRGRNLVANGGFEADGAWDKQGNGFEVDQKIWRSGRRSMRCTVERPAVVTGAQQLITLHPPLRHPLQVSLWTRATTDCVCEVYLDLHYADGTALWGEIGRFQAAPGEWRCAELVCEPEKLVETIEIHIVSRESCGSVWVDDVRMALAPFEFRDLRIQPGAFGGESLLVEGITSLPAKWRVILEGPRGAISQAGGRKTPIRMEWHGPLPNLPLPWRTQPTYRVRLVATDYMLGQTLEYVRMVAFSRVP